VNEEDDMASGRLRFADWAATGLLAAAAQFVVLTLVAMLVYAGGSKFDPAAGGYAFFHNFFSDLGMTEVFDGASNTPAMILFAYALICIGVSLVAFGFAVRRLRGVTSGPGGGPARGARAAGVVAAIAATISGVAYIGIALTPHDLAAAAHNQFVNFAFGFLLVFVLCLGFLEVRAGWPQRLIVANYAYAVLLAVYVYLLFWGPSTDYERGLVIQVVAQKVIVYSSILNLGWQALGFRRALRLESAPDTEAALVPEQAAAD
jgi:hypothetical membrane protein